MAIETGQTHLSRINPEGVYSGEAEERTAAVERGNGQGKSPGGSIGEGTTRVKEHEEPGCDQCG